MTFLNSNRGALNGTETPIQRLSHPLLKKHNLTLSVKRDDLIHPFVSGNKWRKLKYNLQYAVQHQYSSVLSFGGAFSNHIYALAAAGKAMKINTIAIVRGLEVDLDNPTLAFAAKQGMQLERVDRQTYRKRNDRVWLNELQTRYRDCFIIPEGGSNSLAIRGVEELAQTLNKASHIITPIGSGGTLSGLISGAKAEQKVIGVAVLKGAEYLKEEVGKLTPPNANCKDWTIWFDFHHGGYGKFSNNLWQFCVEFQNRHAIPIEPIYSGKMFYALMSQIELGYFPSGSHIIAVHTGGLQGLNGLRYRKILPYE